MKEKRNFQLNLLIKLWHCNALVLVIILKHVSARYLWTFLYIEEAFPKILGISGYHIYIYMQLTFHCFMIYAEFKIKFRQVYIMYDC